MEFRQDYQEWLRKRNMPEDRIEVYANEVAHYLEKADKSDLSSMDFLKYWCSHFVAKDNNAYFRLAGLFYWFNFNKQEAEMMYLLNMFGTTDVMESQLSFIKKYVSEEQYQAIIGATDLLPLGTNLEEYPEMIRNYLETMQENLSLDTCKKVLAQNHHLIPVESFAKEKEYYQQSASLEEYLKGRHDRLIKDLDEHYRQDKMWYELRVTPEIIEFVKTNQEIQAGVLEGNRIIVRKIPFQCGEWLQEKDPVKKRHYACHCPFVRSSILNKQEVPSLWCYCTGGYEKVIFEYIFEKELEVESLGTVLDGEEACRFAIILK